MGNIISYGEEEADCDDYYFFVFERHQEPEPEPFDLTALPENAVHKILDKLDYRNYAIWEETSTFTHDICNSKAFSMQHEVIELRINKSSSTVSIDSYFGVALSRRVPFNTATKFGARLRVFMMEIPHRITGNRMRAVAKQLKKNRTIGNTLVISEHVLFSGEDFNIFLESFSQPLTYIQIRPFAPKDLFKYPAIRQVDALDLYSCGCEDEDFVKLQNRILSMKNDVVTARGLNKFLKQWKRGEQDCTDVDIHFDNSFNTRSFDAILEGLDANIIWTPDTHKDSLIAALPIEEVQMMFTADPQHLYSLCRSDDIHYTLLLRLTMGRFEVMPLVMSEGMFLLTEITFDQYYTVTNKCGFCDLEFCEHYRRYSARRFKQFYPRAYNVVVNCFTVARFFFDTLRFRKLVEGVTYPVQPISNDQIAQIQYEENVERGTFRRYWLELRVLLFNQ